MRALFLMALVVPFLAGHVAGQQPEPLHAGDRVRVSRGSMRGVFTLVDTEDHTLLLFDSATSRSFRQPSDSIDRLEVRRPRLPLDAALRAGAVGLVVGGATGALVGVLSGADDRPCFPVCMSAGEKAALLGGALGGAGFLIGFFTGVAHPGEHWLTVAVPAELSITVPGRGGLGVSISRRRPRGRISAR